MQIQKNQVRWVFNAQRLHRPGVGDTDQVVITLCFQNAAQQVHHQFLVVDDQNAGGRYVRGIHALGINYLNRWSLLRSLRRFRGVIYAEEAPRNVPNGSPKSNRLRVEYYK